MARVLIVDDSPTQLMGIQRIVEKLGHETFTATDGAAGVEAAMATLPDLVLMDVMMPRMDGIQATSAILERTPAERAPRIIVLTTFDLDEYVVAAIRAGDHDLAVTLTRENWSVLEG